MISLSPITQAGGGLGYEDLNQLMKCPEDLEFVIELLNVEQEYEKAGFSLVSQLHFRFSDLFSSGAAPADLIF